MKNVQLQVGKTRDLILDSFEGPLNLVDIAFMIFIIQSILKTHLQCVKIHALSKKHLT